MNKKILLLDRDNDILNLAHEIMFYGYSDMHITSDPAALYQIATYYQPDLIILDMTMVANDFDVLCEKFRHNDQLKNIPLIAVSKAYNRVINDSIETDAVFIKPIDNEEFASRISYLMAS